MELLYKREKKEEQEEQEWTKKKDRQDWNETPQRRKAYESRLLTKF
jgi:hypothetical protein